MFVGLAKILGDEIPRIVTSSHQQRTQYVAEIAEIWRLAGLKPSRANNPWTVGHRSRFNRFADLVLTALQEPQAQRHDGNAYALSRAIKRAHASLPEEIRPLVSCRTENVSGPPIAC